jgi:EpsD family peptidyl-prolyl cis-trans isomerase
MSAFAAKAVQALGLLLALTACTPQDPALRPVVQVNRETISVRPLQDALERQGALGPEQRAALAPQVLERLIDQELALQQAEALKLDRDPRVAAQLDAARRELMARAYAQSLAADVPAPTDEEVAKHYASVPQLYAQRQVFRAQELLIDGPPSALGALQAQVPAGADFGLWLTQAQAAGLRVQPASVLRPTEQWPAALQGALPALADGQWTVVARPGGLWVVQRLGAQAAPWTLAQARPAIEQQLWAERRQAQVQAGLRRLREKASVTYLGSVAAPASAAASAGP